MSVQVSFRWHHVTDETDFTYHFTPNASVTLAEALLFEAVRQNKAIQDSNDVLSAQNASIAAQNVILSEQVTLLGRIATAVEALVPSPI